MAEFKDTWALQDVDIAWLDLIEAKHEKLHQVIQAAMTKSDKSYLIYMAIRLLEMSRLIKSTGSIYLHCDPTMSHYLKLLMDAIFGRGNFRNEIIWCYTGPNNSRRQFQRKHDVILFYGMDEYVFYADSVRVPYKTAEPLHLSRGFGDRSEEDIAILKKQLGKGKVPTDWWADGFLTNISAWKKEHTGAPLSKA